MSYHIVSKIKILPDKVMVTGHNNNVYPKKDEEWEAVYFQPFLNDPEKIETEILLAYETGDFQAGRKNKWTRALEILRHLEEYKKFDWHNKGTEEARTSPEFEELLKKALRMKLPKEKFVIVKNNNGQKMYFHHRKGSHYCSWHTDPKDATIFHWKEDAERKKKWFYESDSWQVEELKN